MPTLPLYDSPADPNAWHRVRSPGGYEFWRFHVDDPEKDHRIVMIFSLGGLLRDDYARRAARYLRRPTTNQPPVPSDYPAVLASIMCNGRQATTQIKLAARDFEASTRPTVIRFGANLLRWNATGMCQIEFRHDQMHVQLAFEMLANVAVEHRPATEHHRIALALSGQATGSLRGAGRDIPLTATGTYEHRYGTRPIDRAERERRFIQTDAGTPLANRT